MSNQQTNHFVTQLIALACSLFILTACTVTVNPLDIQPVVDPTPTEESAAVAQSIDAGVLPTAVTYVQTLATINVRSGPGLDYREVSFAEEGETVPVFGISADSNWWLVLCPNNTIGCWITAGPSYTQPTADANGTVPLNDIADAQDTTEDQGIADNPDADDQDVGVQDAGDQDTGGPIPVDSTEEAIIDDLSVRLLEASPLQLEAVVSGQLPDACAFIERADAVREGSSFRINLTIARQPNQRCAPTLTPFEETVPLDVSGLPAGDYNVRINNRVTPFALAVARQPAPVQPAPAVVEQIQPVVVNDPAQGVQSVNVTVTGTVADTCTEIGAINQRQEGNTFFVEITTTRPAEVECTQVITNFERTIPLEVTGLPPGFYQLIVNGVEQTFTWPDVSAETPPETPPVENPPVDQTEIPTQTVDQPPTIPTDVTNIVALQNVPIYTGPSVDSLAIGELLGGQGVGVIDSSLDGGWWHIQCPTGLEGNASCWVTSDPNFTQISAAGE